MLRSPFVAMTLAGSKLSAFMPGETHWQIALYGSIAGIITYVFYYHVAEAIIALLVLQLWEIASALISNIQARRAEQTI